MWHEIADKYIEYVKGLTGDEKKNSLAVLRHVYVLSLRILHPFMPFVTESIWENISKLDGESDLLVSSNWPEV
jgi:valyl-tRNA synthetase